MRFLFAANWNNRKQYYYNRLHFYDIPSHICRTEYSQDGLISFLYNHKVQCTIPLGHFFSHNLQDIHSEEIRRTLLLFFILVIKEAMVPMGQK